MFFKIWIYCYRKHYRMKVPWITYMKLKNLFQRTIYDPCIWWNATYNSLPNKINLHSSLFTCNNLSALLCEVIHIYFWVAMILGNSTLYISWKYYSVAYKYFTKIWRFIHRFNQITSMPYLNFILLKTCGLTWLRYMQRIPENFFRKFKDDLAVVATLTVPNGNISRVGLRRADNKIWFYDGWKEFMERYSIRVGYFLVFRYEGNSAFNVYIFNLPSSEINYQPNALSNFEVPNHSKQYHIFAEMEDDDSEIVDHSTQKKTFNPAFQNLLSSSKLSNSVNGGGGEGNLHRLKGSDNSVAGNEYTWDIGVHFDIYELNNLLNHKCSDIVFAGWRNPKA